MGLFRRNKKLRDLLAESSEMLARTEETLGSIRLDDVLLQAFLGKGRPITREEAMQIPTFEGCVNKICETVSIIPIKLYKKEDGGAQEMKDDERVRLINLETGDTLTGSGLKKALVYDYLTSQGGYAFINKHGDRFLSLNYVDATQVSFLENTDPIFKDYKICVNGKTYEGYQFLKVIRRSKNGYYGKSIIDEGNEALRVAYLNMKYEGKLLRRGGNKKGFLESERKLDKDAITELKDGFNRMYQDDEENAIVLNNGVKFHESSSSSTEMQLNENKKSNAEEICKMFGMPPGILKGGATKEEKDQYIQFCIIPIMEEIVEVVNRDLLLEKEKAEYYFAYDVSDLTKADIKTRYEAYAIGYKNKFLQIPEIRKMENLQDIDIPFLMLGLNDVLYDPENGDIFIPNMNQWANIKDPNKFPKWTKNGEVITTSGDTKDDGEEEKEDEGDDQG